MSVPARRVWGLSGSADRQRTMASECMPWSTPARDQDWPLLALRMTPWPAVATRMVMFLFMIAAPFAVFDVWGLGLL